MKEKLKLNISDLEKVSGGTDGNSSKHVYKVISPTGATIRENNTVRSKKVGYFTKNRIIKVQDGPHRDRYGDSYEWYRVLPQHGQQGGYVEKNQLRRA